jgi:predicted nucleic acid-binding protein
VPVFVDTNVLVYARDTAEPAKQAQAEEWIHRIWQRGVGRLSVQVLQEYYVTTTRRLEPGLAPGDAQADVEDLLAWHPVTIDGAVLRRSWLLEDRFALSFWDALIVAAAHAARCDVLLTEDLQDQQDLDGLRVVNPFNHSPASVL